ncbi:MAG: hypothetical protein ACRCUE_17160 [Bosea sp. (in: a-proteobacteria)]
MIRFAAWMAAVFLGFGAPAMAQNDQLAACERFAVAFSKKQGGTLSRVQIERGDTLTTNRFDDKVGSQAVSVEYVGFARVTDQSGSKRQRFICLHEGERGRAVYFGVFYE